MISNVKVNDPQNLLEAMVTLVMVHPSVKSVEIDGDRYRIMGYNGDCFMEHTNPSYGLNWLYANYNNRISLHIAGKYYFRIELKVESGVRCFSCTMVSDDRRMGGSQKSRAEHYNFLGGYWYTSTYDAPKGVLKKMQSLKVKCIVQVLRNYNKAYFPF